jgi:hypothetical protein
VNELLPDDLVWEVEADAPHLSEIALTAIADGEEAILPADARAHAETCDACARKLGEAAMLSSAIGDALRASTSTSISSAIESSRPRARLPLGAIAAGLALALFGAIPMLLELPAYLSDARIYAYRGLPVVFRSGVSAARSAIFHDTTTMLTIASAFVLVVASLVLLRRLPPQRIATEGVS